MKIGITAMGKNLDADVDQRFGRCRYFIIVDTESMDFETLSNENVMASGGAGVQAAQTIANKGIEAIITGNVGPNAFQTLSAAGIRIYTGASGTVREVIEKYKKGEFKETENPNVGSHSGMRR
ncbi:dinitrogenase iron-molybdenum cofactor biosynthesis protein [Candidatus Heimdallarchaeota archaeon]|nr:MAG: dinitrogenase iron-molybdenum cofactor biosynthesis protein [Candidatus Heimdallarchaeota archaeon]